MKEYTLLVLVSLLTAVITNFILKTKLFLNKRFWVFWVVIFVMISIVNGYLTWRPIVMYGEGFYVGLRLFTIPIEDFLFGFSLITLNISIWEFLTRKYLRAENVKD
jgi:lycopene cyclase domain-containing protein